MTDGIKALTVFPGTHPVNRLMCARAVSWHPAVALGTLAHVNDCLWRSKMETPGSHQANALLAFSDGLANAVERAGSAIVAINARERIPSSGILWRAGVVATADHTIKREEEITVLLPDG